MTSHITDTKQTKDTIRNTFEVVICRDKIHPSERIYEAKCSLYLFHLLGQAMKRDKILIRNMYYPGTGCKIIIV